MIVRIVLKTLLRFLVITLGSMLLPVVCPGEGFTIGSLIASAWIFNHEAPQHVIAERRNPYISLRISLRNAS